MIRGVIEEKERLIVEGNRQLASELRSQATKLGMQRAVEQGIHVGRPHGSAEDESRLLTKYPQVVGLLGQGISLRDIAYETRVAGNTVRKVKATIHKRE